MAFATNSAAVAVPLGVGEIARCAVFSAHPEQGGQTVVMRLPAWPSRRSLQWLARSSGVAEATFVVAQRGALAIRWFAGDHEVPLCGHGALAAAAVLMGLFGADELYPVDNLEGRLWVGHSAGRAIVAFRRALLTELPARQLNFGVQPLRVFDAGRDYLVVLEHEEQLLAYQPDAIVLSHLAKIGCILTAPCAHGTAVFRFFAPRVGLLEDRASGSVIPALAEYWSVPGQQEFLFLQRSGGDIRMEACLRAERILVRGNVIELQRTPLPGPLEY